VEPLGGNFARQRIDDIGPISDALRVEGGGRVDNLRNARAEAPGGTVDDDNDLAGPAAHEQGRHQDHRGEQDRAERRADPESLGAHALDKFAPAHGHDLMHE